MVSPRLFQRQNDRIFHRVSKGENVIVKYRGNQHIFRSEMGIEQLSTFYAYVNAFFSRKYEVLPEVLKGASKKQKSEEVMNVRNLRFPSCRFYPLACTPSKVLV